MNKGLLLVISGPSGVGKGTVCDFLLKDVSDINYSISATTRKKRPLEEHGKNYFFCSVDEFEEMISKGELIEYAKVHGNYYGTPKDFVIDSIKNGKVVILEIDVQGAMQVKNNYPNATFIFILPPDINELRNRIENRSTEDEETINLRMKNAKEEMEYSSEYDYVVINNVVEETVKEIKNIINNERNNRK